MDIRNMTYEAVCAWCDATDVPMVTVPDGEGRLACIPCIEAGKVKTKDGQPVVLAKEAEAA